MTAKINNMPLHGWTEAAKTINQAGKNLQTLLGDQPIRTNDIDQEIRRISEYKHHSVPPSDYCYNLINKGTQSFQYWVFEWLERGSYKYLGPNYNYSGPVLWKGEQVGEWKSGKLKLWKDLRNN